MFEILEPVGKVALPISIISAALIWPRPEPAPVILELPEIPAPVINLEIPEPSSLPELPEMKAPIVTVNPTQPIITEKVVEVPGPTVYEDREVIVERIVEVPACLDYAALPYFDLANAISVTRPGESWSLSGDYYNGLNWLADTPKPTFTEIVGGWLMKLETEC
jgi:hypothetical protein